MADEYISRQAALNKINERQRKLIYCFGFENDAVKIMDIAKSIVIAIPSAQPELESADVAPVVRCKECKFRENDDFCTGRGFPYQLVPDDGFCDKGEREE